MDLNCNGANGTRDTNSPGARLDARLDARGTRRWNDEGAPSYSPRASVRWDKVRELRRQIAEGTYETEAKWAETLARLRQSLAG